MGNHISIIGNTTILRSHLFSPDTITVTTTGNVHTVTVILMDMVERVEGIMDSLICMVTSMNMNQLHGLYTLIFNGTRTEGLAELYQLQ
tara:strand:- start:10 stop:276 length:267 start_codon:yes stop_codon:yes gene_type:complete